MRIWLSALALMAGTAQAQTAPQTAMPTPAPPPVTAAVGTPRILIASDSTAQTYDVVHYPQGGWGQFLACGMKPDAIVINRAIGGRSTKSFIAEGRWDRLMAELKPGDTILIQFGHNDATKAKPERFADPALFRDNLLRMIWQSRGAGGNPVLVTPVARRNFDEAGKSKADFAEYSAVMRELAASTNTPLIDLEGASRNMIDRMGPEGARKYYMNLAAGVYPAFPQGQHDDTHFNELGARAMANLVAEQLAGLGVPAAALVMAQRPDLERKTMLGNYACH